MRSPSLWSRPKGPPRPGWVFAVVYIDQREQTSTTLFRVFGAAERFARRVEARGGTAEVYRAPFAGPWERSRWSR